jgi:hypothetical protein
LKINIENLIQINRSVIEDFLIENGKPPDSKSLKLAIEMKPKNKSQFKY